MSENNFQRVTYRAHGGGYRFFTGCDFCLYQRDEVGCDLDPKFHAFFDLRIMATACDCTELRMMVLSLMPVM